MYEKEIKRSLDAGHIVSCRTESSEWASKAVLKGDGTSVCIVLDCKRLNCHIKRPNLPIESSSQLLQHIDLGSKYFVAIDLTIKSIIMQSYNSRKII